MSNATILGRRAIAGISSNADGASVDLAFTWYTPTGSIIVAAGQIVPLSGSIAHSADIKTVKDNKGNEVTIYATNEKLTIEVVAVPLGSDLSGAESAAQFPAPAGWLTIASAPSITIGGFGANAINADNWSYNGDGRIEMASDGEWGMRFSCTRRLYIAKGNASVV